MARGWSALVDGSRAGQAAILPLFSQRGRAVSASPLRWFLRHTCPKKSTVLTLSSSISTIKPLSIVGNREESILGMRGCAAIFLSFLPCLLIFLFWKPQWSKIVEGTSRLMAKTILADEIDMFPSQRG